jgi:hypothetical protein
MSLITVQELIDGARVRHACFADTVLGDGAAVLFLNQRIRTLLLRYRSALRALINATMQAAAVVNGALVGVDALGAPSFLTTVADGWAVHVDGAGVPYVETTEAPIASDPFGASGGTPGFPLPTDAIALFSVFVVYRDGSSGDVDVVDEAARNFGPPGHNAAAFLSGNRIVPIRPAVAGAADIWSSVVAVQLSYLPLPTVRALADTVPLPAAVAEALVAALAELFAIQSPSCADAVRAAFSAAARRAEDELDLTALDVVGDLQHNSVLFTG